MKMALRQSGVAESPVKMPPEYGIKLAVHLISTDFGDHAAKVCDSLLRNGALSLNDIVRTTKLSPQQVKTYLKVLTQHNCVQAFAMEQGGSGKGPLVVVQYMLLFDNILQRMRFPKLLAIVSEELDKECEELFEAFLEHGWLTLQQILDRVPSNQSEGNCTVQDTLQGNFTKLVNARFIEQCPAPDPFLVSADEEKTAARKRKAVEESEVGEQCDMAKVTPTEAKGVPVVTDTCSDIHGSKSMGNLPGIIFRKKRKQDALELDAEPAATSEKDVPWQANYKEFVCHLKHKACIENARVRLDSGAAFVLSAMLQATGSMVKNAEENSVPLSIDTIAEAVMKSEAGHNMTLEHIKASLVQLGCYPNGVEADETYKIDLKKIIELAQNEEVESLVLKRYGREAHRIFRLLSRSQCLLETDKISDTVFIEKKEAAKILYKLWKDDYLHVEKIVINESQFMLWKVKKDISWQRILDEMYHAALNMSIRIIEVFILLRFRKKMQLHFEAQFYEQDTIRNTPLSMKTIHRNQSDSNERYDTTVLDCYYLITGSAEPLILMKLSLSSSSPSLIKKSEGAAEGVPTYQSPCSSVSESS